MDVLKMRVWLKFLLCFSFLPALCAVEVLSQDFSAEFDAKIDSLIIAAYQTAAEEFPCKVKAKGKMKMIDWKAVEKCLNDADDRVDWENISRQIEILRREEGASWTDVSDVVESALSAHIIPYSRVFKVNKKDALLPLSNTVLKFLPADSLKDLPVYDNRLQKRIGTFFTRFTYEKSGGLSAANTYKLSLFQYTDLEGDLQAPTIGNRLLLDSFGVPWKDASSRPGFRLTSHKLGFKY